MLAQITSLYFCKVMRLDFGFRHLLPRILSNQIVHMCSLAMSITLKDRNSHMSTAEQKPHTLGTLIPPDNITV